MYFLVQQSKVLSTNIPQKAPPGTMNATIVSAEKYPGKTPKIACIIPPLNISTRSYFMNCNNITNTCPTSNSHLILRNRGYFGSRYRIMDIIKSIIKVVYVCLVHCQGCIDG